MRNFLLFALLALIVSSCNMRMNKKVKGNGQVSTENRDISEVSRIKVRGNINVELVPGGSAVKVEADENLLRYIITREEDGWLVIKTKDNVNLRSNNPIRVYVNTETIRAINIAGSGNVRASGKFSGADKLDIDVAGSGDVDMDVNTPTVVVDIAGSGNVTLAGETRDARVHIAGSGNYEAVELLTERTDIDIAGSGDARVHADVSLKADVLGSGSIYYRGKADIKTKAVGSGRVQRIE